MIAVVVVFAVLRFLAIQQLGFALALAVLLDTTMILLPALMGVCGKYLWYFPSWLKWIPGGSKRMVGGATTRATAAAPADN